MKDKKTIAIGILAYNEELNIENVIRNLLTLNVNLYIINDFSKDNTKKILEQFKNLENVKIINNNKNLGAGISTKRFIQEAVQDGYEFIVKVDGDGQFLIEDVIKIIDIYLKNDYEFIKSNRFWANGIVGKIPKIRFFGNLFATLLMQFAIGSNLLLDPLNGLFGVSTKIHDKLNSKSYPKRYGYPFFITISAVLNNFKTKQINNTVVYANEKSNLNSFKIFFTLLKLSILFYFKKYKLKKIEGKLQKSAFFDIVFVFFTTSFLALAIYLLITTFAEFSSFINSNNLFNLIFISLFLSIYSFNISYKEENIFRNDLIDV